MNIAEASIQYKTITLVMVFLILGGGIYSYEHLSRLEDPEFTIKDAKVYTFYPGATALETSEEVTDQIEIAVQQLGQLKRVTSMSTPGISMVQVTIKDKYNKYSLPQVWDELRRKVNDAQRNLPPGTSTSIVYDDFGDVFGVFLAVYGDGYTYAELKDYVKILRRELLLCDDVAKISTYGEQEEQIYLEVSRARISQLGIEPNLIYQSLKGQNLVAPAGKVDVDTLYLRIQPTGEFTSIEDIGNLLIIQDDPKGTRLYLRDIAKIYRGYIEPPTNIMQFNGHPAIGLGISTVLGGNVVIMGNSVNKRLEELQAQTPIGMEIGIIAHQANAVTASIDGFIASLIQAILIVIAVLMITMGLRSGILIGVILLLTVLGTFIVMNTYNIILERISLGALIIALGMLVDNAIVVIEGVLVNLQRGMKRKEAASQIVSQTMWPLFGATIVAILAFAAIGASQDSTGEYCRSLFFVIMISLTLSWVLAVTVTPLLGFMFIKVKESGSPNEVTDPYAGSLFKGYKKFLTLCLHYRKTTMLTSLTLLILAAIGFNFVDQSFFPNSTRPQFMLHYWLAQGTKIEKTKADLSEIEKHLSSIDGVTDVATFVGQGAMRFLLTYTPEDNNSAYGMLLISVKDYREIKNIMPQIQTYLNANFPNALAMQRPFILGPGDAQKIQARFRGPDPKVLRQISDRAEDIMHKEPSVRDIMSDWRERVPLIRPLVAETQARNAGITRSAIARALQTSFTGIQIGIYREGDKLLPIMSRAPESERNDVDYIHDIQIWSPMANQAIPISQVIMGFESTSEDSIVRRRNRQPTITLKCDPAHGTASAALEKLMPEIEAIPLPTGYELEWGGEYENSNDAQTALASKLPITALLMILIVIILFNSIRKPIIIFMIVPFALIGVTAGLLLAGQPFGFMALLGFLSLSGMLIKNAIVLIDEINTQNASGKPPFDAIVDSGISRLRPVSMAALTTVLGMVPLLKDAFFVSMAVTIMFGLSFATLLTLIIVPVLYVILYKIPYKPQINTK